VPPTGIPLRRNWKLANERAWSAPFRIVCSERYYVASFVPKSR